MTRELLSEVLGIDAPYVEKIDNRIYYEEFGSMTGKLTKYINIYELAHKCKEWAYRQSYCLSTWLNFEEGDKQKWWCSDLDSLSKENRVETKIADTEPEAIFQSAQWILKQKEVEL